VILDVPAETPVTKPDAAFTVAIPVLLLVQVPPLVLLLKVDVRPAQIVVVPVLALTAAFTVTTAVRAHVPPAV
jgi:hypothetical protein